MATTQGERHDAVLPNTGTTHRGVVRLLPAGEARAAAIAAKECDISDSSSSGAHEKITEQVEIEDHEGQPQRINWRGLWYSVTAEPMRWFQRRPWWLEEARAERGRAGIVAEEIWRLQVEMETASWREVFRNPDSHHNLRRCTLDIGHHLPSRRWRLIRIHKEDT